MGVAFLPLRSVAPVEVGVPVSVPLAAGFDAPEQRAGRAVPGKLRELVDGPDQERGGEPVDLLVDGNDRDAFALAVPGREGAIPVLAEDEKPLEDAVVPAGGLGVDRVPAPRAVGELQRRCRSVVVAAQPGVRGELRRVARGVWRHRPADPHAEPARNAVVATVGPGALLTQQLRRADQRCGTLELLSREQAQRVAHQDRNAVTAVHCPVTVADDALEAPRRQGVRHEPQVGFGLAAASREEQ